MSDVTGMGTRGGSPRVLCLTYDLDPTADYVLDELNRRGVGFWRVDLSRFVDTSLNAELTTDGRWSGRWDIPPDRGVDLSQVQVVWWRKPTTFRWPDTMSEPERRFAESQARQALSGVFASLPDVLWVNPPDVVAECTKPRQLAVAAWAGLPVPRTLITSDPAGVEPFAVPAAAGSSPRSSERLFTARAISVVSSTPGGWPNRNGTTRESG